MASYKPKSVKDVPAEDFIKAYSAHLKANDKVSAKLLCELWLWLLGGAQGATRLGGFRRGGELSAAAAFLNLMLGISDPGRRAGLICSSLKNAALQQRRRTNERANGEGNTRMSARDIHTYQ